jgi:phosphatidylglycerophosphate synthase
MHTMDMAELAVYVPGMRRAVKPFWCRVRSLADAQRCKSLLVESAQKGTLDVVAWYVNRPIENWIVRRIADLPLTPNQVSLFTNLVAYGVPALFLTGHFLPGVLLALAVNVLDGVDGKLARVKGLTSYLGELEHSFDLLYEQAWYLSFYWALYLQTHNLPFLALGAVMALLDSFSRHCSMQFKLVTGVSLADYAPFDRWFRRLDGRRNIYSVHILVAVLASWPVMAAWTMVAHAVLTAGVYSWRAAKHLRRMDLGHARTD